MTAAKKTSTQMNSEVHVKKHDHSVLGKHTKEEKARYLEGLNIDEEKPALVETENTPHVKKHDHSILGKHSKKDKKKYLEELAAKNE
jgi:hypothetical protein